MKASEMKTMFSGSIKTLIDFIQRHRRLIIVLVLLVVFVWVAAYLMQHPEIFATLTHISLKLLAAIVALDFVAALGLLIMLVYSVRLFGKRIKLGDAFLLNSYSSIANFFGPGQSGTGVRAVYLKAKLAIRIRDFVVASLIYYAFYSVISMTMLFVGAGQYIVAVIAAIVAIAASLVVISIYRRGKSLASIRNPKAIIGIAIGTILQIAAICAIYYLEVDAVSPGVHFMQAVSYTGSANMSLFVSLTPGAIGFREAFLLASQSLHHISTSTIVAAGVIDRAVYVLFLGVLAISVGLLHGRRRLGVKIP